MKIIILAGGSGTRLWPLSRKHYPKQFLSLGRQDSFLQTTVRRLRGLSRPEEVVILTNEAYKFSVINQVKAVDPRCARNVLLEPVGRNTAPA
ncbi:MAG TPA: sugar phosphate nucleotidyltransferase, partial [bacterium]|nr:sugar phosphate nucleotidyltransferase [bacterium]